MDFQKAIAKEKERIKSAIADLNKEKKKIDTDIASLQNELDAVLAYENAKKGKTTRTRTSVKSKVLAVIKTTPSTRAEIIKELNFTDNKSKQQTVSNTLSQLKKKGEITLTDGVYSST